MSRAGAGTEGRRRETSLRTVVISGNCILLLSVTALFAMLIPSVIGLRNDALRSRRADDVSQAAGASERSVIDLETGVRGYLITGERRFLAPYVQARAILGPELSHLESLTGDDRAQEDRVRGIAAAVASYERSYAVPLAEGSGHLRHAQNVAVTSAGKRLVDAIRERFAAVEQSEELRSEQRRAATTSKAQATLIASAASFAFIVLLLVFFATYFARAILAPIVAVAGAATSLRESDLGVRVPEYGRGEVGELARAFNSMSRTIQERGRSLRRAHARLQVTARELERSEQHARKILESAHDAFVSMDEFGQITNWNAQAEVVFGWSCGEALGRDLAETIIPARCREQHLEGLERYRATREGNVLGRRLELTGLRRDGSEFPLELTISALRTDGRDSFNAFLRDIGERKRFEGELASARDEAIEASRQKSEFLANMSHEIRTPLNGVIGMADLLGDTTLDPVQREYVGALAASGDALLAVISDILDFSKIEAGHLELDCAEFDLRATVEHTCLMLAEPAHAKGIELSHRVEGDVPAAVSGDPARLRQILLHLISNAVKFTASGEVLVCVSRAERGRIHFTVSDTGVGIDEHQVASLFEAFTQADPSTTRKYGGTGLGLAISRQLVERMGGEIGAAAREWGGSVFWFTVELAPVASAPSESTDAESADAESADAESADAESARVASQPDAGHRASGIPGSTPGTDGQVVLIAEDNEINRAVAKALLAKRGLRTEIARNGLEAVRMAVAKDYAAILMDCQMPELDGYEATRRIRAAENERHVPIIAMTAHSMQGDRERCLAAGMDDYLSKPVRNDQLDEAIRRWLSDRQPAAGP